MSGYICPKCQTIQSVYPCQRCETTRFMPMQSNYTERLGGRYERPVVSITPGCPIAPGPCNCTGACQGPVPRDMKIEALRRELRKLEQEEQKR